MTQQQIQNLSFSKAISSKKKDDQSYRPYHNLTTSGYGTECLSTSSDDEEMTENDENSSVEEFEVDYGY